MKPRHTLLLSLLLTASLAHAQSTEAEFDALARAYKITEIEALARERLKANPKDEVALWAWGRSVSGDAKKRAELLPQAESCAQERPQSAYCHSLLGSLYGSAAMSGGMSEAMKYVGRIKDSFLKAVELSPKHFDMRRDLIQFYLQAPGIAGGSVRKARDQATEFAALDPARGTLLRAEIHAYEEEYPKAEALLLGVKPGKDTELASDLHNSFTTLGFAYLQAKQFDKAQSLFERVVNEDKSRAFAHFGLGRALLERQQFDPAIAAFERALQINPKQTLHYRLGMAYLGKGDKAKAAAAFKQFISYQATGKQADESRKRLAELGAAG
jgi:tetratricopeptide (TPR) repeat protein